MGVYGKTVFRMIGRYIRNGETLKTTASTFKWQIGFLIMILLFSIPAASAFDIIARSLRVENAQSPFNQITTCSIGQQIRLVPMVATTFDQQPFFKICVYNPNGQIECQTVKDNGNYEFAVGTGILFSSMNCPISATTFRVVIDPDRQISESSESNNEATFTLQVNTPCVDIDLCDDHNSCTNDGICSPVTGQCPLKTKQSVGTPCTGPSGVGNCDFLGICTPSCTNQCVINTKQCSGTTAYQTCILGTNGCTQWNTVNCQTGQTCSGGNCMTSCTNQCILNAKQCSGTTAYQTCILGTNGCTQWNTVNCQTGQTCSGGNCNVVASTTLPRISVTDGGLTSNSGTSRWVNFACFDDSGSCGAISFKTVPASTTTCPIGDYSNFGESTIAFSTTTFCATANGGSLNRGYSVPTTVTVITSSDTNIPSITIDNVRWGDLRKTSRLATIHCDDNGISCDSSVGYKEVVAGTTVCTGDYFNGGFSFGPTITATSTKTFCAVGRDASFNVAYSAPVTISVVATPPTISLTESGLPTGPKTVTFTCTNDGLECSTAFKIVPSSTTDCTYHQGDDLYLSETSTTITRTTTLCVLADGRFFVTYSSPTIITITTSDTIPPTITLPGGTGTGSVTVTATCADCSLFKLYALLPTDVACPTITDIATLAPYTIPNSNTISTPGTYRYCAAGKDIAGNTAITSLATYTVTSSCTPSCTDKCNGADNGCQTGTCTAACGNGKGCIGTTCVPCSGCPQLGKQCGGPYLDGCGGTVDCGTCSKNRDCKSDGQCDTITVEVQPTPLSLQPGGTQQLTTTIRGTSIQTVLWQTTSGTITQQGFFSAPQSGSATITATSTADQQSSGTAIATIVCTNECSTNGLSECVGNGFRACSNYDTDPCLEWSSTTPCAAGCLNGDCADVPFENILQLYNPPTVTNLIGTPVTSTVVQTRTTCTNNQPCTLLQIEAEKVCTSEGTYTVRFTLGEGAITGSHEPITNTLFRTSHTVDWNTKKWCHGIGESITCIGGRKVNWSDNARACCGARPESNCGQTSGGQLCAQTQRAFGDQAETWEWIRPATTQGDIINITCGPTAVLSDGNTFLSCSPIQGIQTGNSIVPTPENEKLLYLEKPLLNRLYATHGYLCAQNPYGTPIEWAECSGDDEPYNARNGYQAYIGENRTINTKVLYCRKDAVWAADLDPNTDANKITCKMAGQHWTGTKCCSEAEDRAENGKIAESYNDPDSPIYRDDEQGACWNSAWAPNGVFFEMDNNRGRIITDYGRFYGCQLGSIDPLLKNQMLLDTKEALQGALTNTPLITDQAVCALRTNVAKNAQTNYYCAKDGRWSYTPDATIRELQSWIKDITRQDCCPTNTCYYSKTDPNSPSQSGCIADQSDDSRYKDYEGYRCVRGATGATVHWEISNPKYTWDRREKGFCPRSSQCLVDPLGSRTNNDNPPAYFTFTTAQRPGCIADTQSILDHYCQNGIWTTRTKTLALTLLDIAEKNSPNDYMLFCDDHESVLNNINYQVGTIVVSNTLSQTCSKNGIQYPCNNNFCLLKYPASSPNPAVVLGTTINAFPDSTEYSFLEVLGQTRTSCSSAAGNMFTKCGSLPVYYNRNTNSYIITTVGNLVIGSTQDGLGRDSILLTKRDVLRAFLSGQTTLTEKSGYLLNASNYPSLYYYKSGGKDLFAYIEPRQYDGTTQKDSLVAIYNNFFLTDPLCVNGNYACTLINSKINGQPHVCSPTCSVIDTTLNKNVRVVSVGPIDSYQAAWTGLTVQVR